MATNRDLLKEAIADAKAVKETAIANAKAALEEAFTPFLKEKLSAKLAEMEDEDEMYDDAEAAVEDADEMMSENEAMEMDEVSLDELLAELDEESDMEENYMEEESLYEAEEEEEEMSIEDMDEDDLKHFIEDVIKDMVSAGELEAGHEGMENEEGEEEMEAGEEEEIDEEINIDELLAEMEEGSLTNAKGKDEHVTDTTEVDDAPYSKEKATKISFDENLDEYLSDVVLSPEEIIASLLGVTSVVAAAALGTPDIRKAIFSAIKSGNVAGAKAIAQNAVSKSKETKSEMEEQLNELRNELNEVNLLNAKLLYTNKIFRNKSLNETQKVKVLTAFDKATSKKEVELVYETLLESLKVTTKTSIKESMGSASKVLGSATSKPIIENDAFARMRELAFGNKK
jgi:exonuclease SbcC